MTEEFDFSSVSIDPATWEEPKQTFPGLVVESQYRLADENYKKATQFRPAITEPLPQWSCRVKRLDAILELPDGSRADAIRYGGIDLKRWSREESRLVNISARYPKEFEISSEWKRVFGQTQPPEILQGRMAMFDFYPSKMYAGGRFAASNVLLPVSVLPPDYQYTGEVRVIKVPEKPTDGAAGDGAPVPGPASGPALSEDQALDVLVANVLPGQRANQVAAIIGSLPPELRSFNSIMEGLASGRLIPRLQSEGRITVATDGTISSVSVAVA